MERAQLRKLRQIEKTARLEREAGLKGLVTDRPGRAWLWSVLEMTGAVGTNPMGEDALRTAFNCGMQNAGQRILAELMEHAPDAFPLMMKENDDARKNRDAALADAGTDDAVGDGTGNASYE